MDGLSASALAGLPGSTRSLLEASREAAPAPVLPPALRPGMTVALVSPASPLKDRSEYDRAVKRMRARGLKPRMSSTAREALGYLAGEDRARGRDLNAAFADEDVDAVWCLRGGYGCLRTLPHVDFDIIRRHPKVFVGYSDITVLHLAIQKLVGLVTFHGPMPGSQIPDASWADVERVVMADAAAGRIGAESSGEAAGPLTLRGGVAEGPLTGGNLSLLTRLMGTPFEPDLRGRILFLEDVGEAPYRVDGMLSQLRLAGKLQACAGVVFGHFTQPKGEGAADSSAMGRTLRELTADLDVPVLWGFRCGHIPNQTTVPYGVRARLDAEAGSLELLRPAVV